MNCGFPREVESSPDACHQIVGAAITDTLRFYRESADFAYLDETAVGKTAFEGAAVFDEGLAGAVSFAAFAAGAGLLGVSVVAAGALSVRSTLRDTGHIHGEQRWRLDVGLVAVARDVGYLLFETVEEAFARRAVSTALMPRRTLHRRWSR